MRNNRQNLRIGVDVGGSSIKCALVDLASGERLERHSVPTPAQGSIERMLDAIATAVDGLPAGLPVGLAFPSVITRGVVRTAAHVNRDWIGRPLERLAVERLARPVTAINDADAAGLGEQRYGAARGERGTVLLLTLGTGIGSALFTGGLLVPNTELGHLEVDGVEAELRAAPRIKTERGWSYEEWSAELNRVISRMHALLWPELIILCGGITDDADQFMPHLRCEAELRIGALRAEAGVVGAALATSLAAAAEA
ncbi:MAG: ROK family protein [Gammaproteobacteria bacterium]|nr:ROK family protein [Gammaproteobacteria bacterium]